MRALFTPSMPFALWALVAMCAQAQSAQPAAPSTSNLVLYGRLDLTLAQQADAVRNREMRNGSGSRFGIRGTEDLGSGLKALFWIEHRFDANTGAQTTANSFWAGRSVVGVEGGFGQVVLGRDLNAAYVLVQEPADPWLVTTVASNGSIVAGRIGTIRYNNSINYAWTGGKLALRAQAAEGTGNPPAGAGSLIEQRPYSVALRYVEGPLTIAAGRENPADRDDRWDSVLVAYKFAALTASGFVGRGRNVTGQRHAAWLIGLRWPIAQGEVRASVGELENDTTRVVLDRQVALGYHHALSRRTTVYADVVTERRDAMPANREKTGWDFGMRHNF